MRKTTTKTTETEYDAEGRVTLTRVTEEIVEYSDEPVYVPLPQYTPAPVTVPYVSPQVPRKWSEVTCTSHN
jgi:hypothetical protein